MGTMERQIISDEVLAVITAAVASMEVRPGHKLVVKSMRRMPQTSPVWNKAGRREQISNKL